MPLPTVKSNKHKFDLWVYQVFKSIQKYSHRVVTGPRQIGMYLHEILQKESNLSSGILAFPPSYADVRPGQGHHLALYQAHRRGSRQGVEIVQCANLEHKKNQITIMVHNEIKT